LDVYLEFASRYVESRTIYVWKPPGYVAGPHNAVLYMHDGQALFGVGSTLSGQEWGVDEVASRLLADGVLRDFLVVGIDNAGAGRHAEFLPQKPFESLPASTQDSVLQTKRSFGAPIFAGPIRSDAYLRFLVDELVPFVTENYSVSADREDTFVMGSSMGGLVSIYAISEYPDVFGAAACLSTHWTGLYTADRNPIPRAMLAYLGDHLPDPGSHRVYFDYGTATLDTLYEPFQLRADSVMRLRGYDDYTWRTLRFEGARHDEGAWRERLHIPLEFLLGKPAP
jgi:enterochelin esterase-like enzyme